MDIVSNRISATPRSKYHKYGYGSSSTTTVSGGGNIDTSNFVKLRGQTSQTIEGNVLSTGDIVAYATSEHDITLPIASKDALGTIKIGNGLAIAEDGTISVDGDIGGGVSSWNDLTDKPSTFPSTWEQITGKPETFTPSAHTHLMADITDFNGVTLDTDQTITGQKTFTKDIIGQADVIAYSTGEHDISLPIASSGALGTIKIGEGLTISEDGTVSVSGGSGTVSEWGDIDGTLSNQTDLWNELNKKANTSELNISNWNTAYNNSHTHSNKSVLDNITSSDTSNWDTAYSRSHTHSNKSVLDGITSTNVSRWNTAYNNNHTHSNKSYLDYINQDLSNDAQPNFRDLTVDYNIVAEEDIYANNRMYTQTLTAYTKVSTGDVSATGDVVANGDVIAYSTGTSSAPFKYWRPSVNSSGVLSWSNSTSETTPSSVNIKGANGEDGASLTYQWSGTSLRIGTTKNGSTTWGSYVNLKGDAGSSGSSFNGGTISNNLTIRKPSSASVFELIGYNATWQATQIKMSNTYYTNYSRQWCIDLGGSQMHVGDLVFNSYNSSGSGSAQVAPYCRIKIRRHGMSDAIQGAGAYTNSSDLRLKNLNRPFHNPIMTLSADTEENTSNSVIDKIQNLNSYYFNWKLPNEIKANSISEEEQNELSNAEYYQREVLGFVAQDLKEVFPEFVYGEESDTEYLTIDYAGLGAVVAVEGLKELNNKVAALENEITKLKNKLSKYEENNTVAG